MNLSKNLGKAGHMGLIFSQLDDLLRPKDTSPRNIPSLCKGFRHITARTSYSEGRKDEFYC